MFDNYFCDLDLDLSSVQHKIVLKRLASYKLYNKEVTKELDKLATANLVAKATLNKIIKRFDSEYYIGAIREGFTTSAALYKIAYSMNDAFMDLVSSLALSNKSLVTIQSFREIIEYYCAFYIVSNKGDAAASFYMNHSTVLEYNLLTEQEKVFDFNLNETYTKSVNSFAKYHNLPYDKSEKILSRPNGWCYGLIPNLSDEYISSKKIRDYVMKMFPSDTYMIFTKHMKTVDMMIHPTPAYVYYLEKEDSINGDLLEFVLNMSSTFMAIVLSKVNKLMDEGIPEKKVFEKVCYVLDTFSKNKILFEGNVEHNYTEISKIKRYDVKQFKKIFNEALTLYNTKTPLDISFYEYIHTESFSLGSTCKYLYKELDRIYTFIDVYYLNYNNFVYDKLPKSIKKANVTRLLDIITYLLLDMAVAYGLKRVKLFQKVYRLFFEYCAVFLYLLKSDEIVNKNFVDLGYVLLESSLMGSSLKSEDVIGNLHKILNRVGVDVDKNVNNPRLRDFTGWTLKSENGKAAFLIQKDINNLLHDSIEELTSMSKSLFEESSAVLHGLLYGDLDNNEILSNDKFGYTYVEFIYRIVRSLISEITKELTEQNDEKLEESANYAFGTLLKHYENFHKKSVRTHKKYMESIK